MGTAPEGKRTPPGRRKVTVHTVKQMKETGVPISALTAYDFLMAELIDRAGIDIVLAGDSAAMVVQGLDTTVSVTLEQMLYDERCEGCLLYTSPSPRDQRGSRMPSSA